MIIITASNSNNNKYILSDFIVVTLDEAVVTYYAAHCQNLIEYVKPLFLIYHTISLDTDRDCSAHPEIESTLFW